MRRYASAVYAVIVSSSVCLSQAEMAKRIITQTTPYDSQRTLFSGAKDL